MGSWKLPCVRQVELPLAVVLAVLGLATGLSAQLPEAPAIDRDVAAMIDGQFTRAHIPPIRTSSDGRVGLNSRDVTQKLLFYLLVPEKLDAHFIDSPIGPEILSDLDAFDGGLDSSLFIDDTAGLGTEVFHSTVCDPTAEFPEPGASNNPYACGNDDCYDFTVITNTPYDNNGETWVQLWGTPTTVRVANPKTPQATIADITTGTPVAGGTFVGDQLFETLTTRDGRLLTGRLSAASYTWTNPITNETIEQTLDIVYSAYDETGDPCDVTRFTAIHPISHAPHDPITNTRYGFAMRTFRDPTGKEIPDGWDLKGSYPWIDRYGRNLFFTSVTSTLDTRYPAACVPGEACGDLEDSPGDTRGHAVVGLWTRGKMVMLDDFLNNTDYGMGALDYSHRMLSLYEPFSGPIGNESGDIRVGTGRDNGVPGRPDGSVYNTSFVDSHENMFNALDHLRPVTPKDVVWIMGSGKATDEFPFDDYTSQHSLIISNMAGLVSYPDENVGMFMDYHDGWDGVSFSQPVRFQNGAAADRWDKPLYGAARGNMRLEPIAMGGIQGKGAWLDGASGIEYALEEQSRPVTQDNWFVSVFVDPRFADDEQERVLVSFPDGSEIRLEGRHGLSLVGAAGRQLYYARLPEPLPRAAWSHLAWTIKDEGRDVIFSLDGFRYSRWTSRDSDIRGFLPEEGLLGLGDIGGSQVPGFVGWVDEFKVIATDLGPEIGCNHARGTVMGLPAGAQGPWVQLANKYPDWSHQQVTDRLERTGREAYPRYFCYADYSGDHLAHLGNQPAEAVSVREALNFPEGPIYFGASRPRSLENNFCLTCHTETSPRGQSLAALEYDASTMAEDDLRRQPMQPYRLAFGHLPKDWLRPGDPIADTVAPAGGLNIDQWDLPHVFATEHKVTSFALIDAKSDQAIAVLKEGETYDLQALGSVRVDVRANTTWPGGSVVFGLNGNPSFSTSNLKPHAVFGFEDGDYEGGKIPLRQHTLTATPYSGPDGTGTAGTPLTVTFTLQSNVLGVAADLREEFQGGAPAPRWTYMWNENGPIGDPANYTPLQWDDAFRYDSDGINGLPDPSDHGPGSLADGIVRPGRGTGEGVAWDHYTIIAYTVESPGLYRITNSSVGDSSGGNGGELLAFRDSESLGGRTFGVGQTVGFNSEIGFVDFGETIYVAVGPNGNSTDDTFDIDFQLEWIPYDLVRPDGEIE